MHEEDGPSQRDEGHESGGPPPDPSLRAWRHPSEIAAAQAAALRDLHEDAGRSSGLRNAIHDRVDKHWSFGSFVLGGTIGAMVMLGAVALGGSLLDGGDGSRVEFRAEGASAAAATVTTDPEGDDEPYDESEHPTTTLGGSGATTASLTRDEWTRLPEPTDGVVAITQLDGKETIATGIVIDGILVTSASALGGAERVLIHANGVTNEVLVRGHDPFADLAVLVPVDDSHDLALGSGFVTAPHAPDTEDVVDLVASDGKPQPIVVRGHIQAVGQRATTRSGRTVMGAMYTSARVPELGAGAALLDEQGRVIGMVIDVEDYLAVALPVERIQRIAAEILQTGWPNPAWVGIEGHTSSEGILITDLDAEGPAADCGLAEGDLITMVNDEPVTDMAELVDAVREAGPGTTVRLNIHTDDNEWTAYLVVGHREELETITAGEAESD